VLGVVVLSFFVTPEVIAGIAFVLRLDGAGLFFFAAFVDDGVPISIMETVSSGVRDSTIIAGKGSFFAFFIELFFMSNS